MSSYVICFEDVKVRVVHAWRRVGGRGGLIREQEMEQGTAPEERRIKTK